MITRRRALPALFVVAALGVLFAVLRVLLRFTAPPPRWDLILPLAVSLLSLAAAWAALRLGAITTREGGQTSRYSWSARRSLVVFVGGCFIPVAAYMVSFAGVSYSAEAWKIRDAGAAIRAVTVQEVLSSDWHPGKNSYYIVRARVDIPYSGGVRSRVGRFRSESGVENGDAVMALYAPTSPGVGAILGANRSVLEEEIGGPANWISFSLLAIIVAFSGFGTMVGGFSRPSTILKKHGEPGRLRTATFMVIGGGAHQAPDGKGKGGTTCHPALLLRGSTGETTTLHMDQPVDPNGAARVLKDQTIRLYWTPAEQTSKRRPLEHHAILVASGDRCLEGWVSAENSGLPEGATAKAGKHLPEGPDLRWVRTSPVWDSALHMVGVRWLLFGSLCLLAAACGFNGFVTAVSAVAAACSPYLATSAVKRKRQAYLRSLAPDTQLPEVPA
jgi:hypothetical protein